jgi:hypothetical protein
MKRRPPHITVTRRWPKKYFGSEPLKARERVLLKRKRTGSFKPDGLKSKRKSKWTLQFHKVFPGLPFDKNRISKVTGIPRSTLNTVYNRGRRAWQTSGSRPGTTANQWGTARLYKFVLVTLRKVPRSWYATKWDPDNNLR